MAFKIVVTEETLVATSPPLRTAETTLKAALLTVPSVTPATMGDITIVESVEND